MERIAVSLKEKSYDVVIGRGGAEILMRQLAGRRVLIAADENADSFYGDIFSEYPKFTVRSGEASKSFETLSAMLERMTALGLDRSSCVVAFGGGVTGDLAGFAAGVYMRGIDFYQVPTTLLAMVDSSVGGKTGINFMGLKNSVGVFHQPKGVYADTAYLASLNDREILCGAGEIVKSAVLDKKIWSFLAATPEPIARMSGEDLDKLVALCVRFKAKVVERDEKESGLRRILNFGHTAGHAFEELNLDGSMRHGEYVLIGMYYETELAKKLGIASEKTADEIERLIFSVKPAVPHIENMDAFYSKLIHDKKNRGDSVTFMLPAAVGDCREVKLERKDIYQLFGEINEEYRAER